MKKSNPETPIERLASMLNVQWDPDEVSDAKWKVWEAKLEQKEAQARAVKKMNPK